MNALSPLLSRDDLSEGEFDEDQVFEESEPVISVTRDVETGYVSIMLNERASRALTAVMNCIDVDGLSEKYDHSWDAELVLARLRAAL